MQPPGEELGGTKLRNNESQVLLPPPRTGPWVLWPRVWLRTALAFRSDLGRRRQALPWGGLHKSQLSACGGRRADLRDAVREPQREVEVAARGTCHSARKCPVVCGPGREPDTREPPPGPWGPACGCAWFVCWGALCPRHVAGVCSLRRGTCSRYLGLVWGPFPFCRLSLLAPSGSSRPRSFLICPCSS